VHFKKNVYLQKKAAIIHYELNKGKSIFFASDFHLGVPDFAESSARERAIIQWLNAIENEAQAVVFLGDIFDFWHEYKTVVPKGFIRLLAKIAQMKENGIDIFFFAGNHDLWLNDYFEKEIGMKVLKKPEYMKINQHLFHIGHGDGLGPGDLKYKLMKSCFRSRFLQWCFSWLHPDIGLRMGIYFSRKSRISHMKKDYPFKDEKEWVIIHCRKVLKEKEVDFFLFGHRHVAVDYKLNEKSRYLNPGDWFNKKHYLAYNGINISLAEFSVG